MGEAMDTEDLKIVAAKLAITEALTRYCRGIDRCDIDALKSSFWPDAVANYGQADQNAWEWGEATLKALRHHGADATCDQQHPHRCRRVGRSGDGRNLLPCLSRSEDR